MLPDVQAQNGDAVGEAGDPLDGVILVGGVSDSQLVPLQDQPGPSAAKAARSRSVELRLELID